MTGFTVLYHQIYIPFTQTFFYYPIYFNLKHILPFVYNVQFYLLVLSAKILLKVQL